VNATKGLKKATVWIVIKIGNSLKEIRHSWYQSIDKKHLWVHVKFECGLLIPFTKKKRDPRKV
jgi:hypothetical protein